MKNPLCFVLMPFGEKPIASGSLVNFDAVYEDLIAPAVETADLEPIRADEEMTGGIIHKPMYERLILCEFAVADLTTANANVFYELGIRHAVRPCSTVLLFAEGASQLPFDVAPLRAIPYSLGADGKPNNLTQIKDVLTERLVEAKNAHTDSPIYQLVENYPDIDHTKADVFRDRVQYSKKIKSELADARKKKDVDELRKIEEKLGDLKNSEAGIIIDLFLSYRSLKSWPNMINIFNKMPTPLAETVMVQEQYALALNRNGEGEKAEKILTELIDSRGPSSETFGILGRVYKDRWENALKNRETILAQGLLDLAIEAYSKGFEADWRDAYPGINAVTLMELKDPPDPMREKLIPIVTYAVERRLASGKPDYWDYATLLELSILAKEKGEAIKALGNALASIREPFEPETTARNLRLIRETRDKRGENFPWAEEIEKELLKKA